jgi:hypothetical protein
MRVLRGLGLRASTRVVLKEAYAVVITLVLIVQAGLLSAHMQPPGTPVNGRSVAQSPDEDEFTPRAAVVALTDCC